MSIREAGRLANVSYCATYNYYKRYCEDPEHKIPLPRNQEKARNSVSTQDHIETLINCIVQDKMSLDAAAVKAKMGKNSARRYYRQYSEVPNHKIPVPPKMGQAVRSCSQGQINALIRYIVNDKMSIENASIKANMSERTGGKYYHRYLNDPDHKIPTVLARTQRSFTQEKINEVIGYIADDKMSISAASLKANMSENAAKKYYDQYLEDPTRSIPAPSKSFGNAGKRYTKKQVSDVIRYIVKNNMYIHDAAKKANMSVCSAKRYYNRYLYDPNHKIPEPNNSSGTRFTQKHVDELIDYICKDKLSIQAASFRARMSEPTARKYYHRYLDSLPKTKKEKCSQQIYIYIYIYIYIK
jgi:transposase